MHTHSINSSMPASNNAPYGAKNQKVGNNGNEALGTNNKNVKEKKDFTDFETFMKIMAAELQNQDPTDPVKNTEYVSQLAQVKSLSQLQGLTNMMMTNSAYNLIGKSVTYQTIDASGKAVSATGTAQAVIMKGDQPYLLVNGQLVKVSDVIMVAPVAAKDGKSK